MSNEVSLDGLVKPEDVVAIKGDVQKAVDFLNMVASHLKSERVSRIVSLIEKFGSNDMVIELAMVLYDALVKKDFDWASLKLAIIKFFLTKGL